MYKTSKFDPMVRVEGSFLFDIPMINWKAQLKTVNPQSKTCACGKLISVQKSIYGYVYSSNCGCGRRG